MHVHTLSYRLVVLLTTFSLLLTSLGAAVHAQEGGPVYLPLVGNGENDVAPGHVLFRTQITVSTSAQWQRLADLGVVVLAAAAWIAADQGNADRADQPRTAGGPDRSALPASAAVVLADFEQLQALARLGFHPRNTDEFNTLVAAGADSKPWLARSLAPLARASQTASEQIASPLEVAAAETNARAAALVSLRSAANSLTREQAAGLADLPSLDDDGDGLTNTEESWWCTDPLNPDSDGDGVSDGDEVAALKDWLANRRAGPPASGRPFAGWPPATFDAARPPVCRDGDGDGVPDMAERWDLGLNMNAESTDRDKFDDGQELFGTTEWGRGALPRVQDDAGYIFAEMPTWVKAPGNHPFVAAFPVPEIEVVASSLKVETVTVVTTDHVISKGTEKSYSTAKTEGTSTSVADTTIWNEWEEFSDARTKPAGRSINDNYHLDSTVLKYNSAVTTNYYVNSKPPSSGLSLLFAR